MTYVRTLQPTATLRWRVAPGEANAIVAAGAHRQEPVVLEQWHDYKYEYGGEWRVVEIVRDTEKS